MDCEPIARAVGSGFSLGSALFHSHLLVFGASVDSSTLYLAKPPLLFSSPHCNCPVSHDAHFLAIDLHDSIHDRSDRQPQWTSTLFRYCHTSQRTINWMFYRLVRLSKLRHAIDTLFPSAIILWFWDAFFCFCFCPCYLCICTSVGFLFFELLLLYVPRSLSRPISSHDCFYMSISISINSHFSSEIS